MYIVYENENKKSLVLKIMDIIGLEKSIYFFGENISLSFDEHFHAYETISSNQMSLINIDRLKCYRPYMEANNLSQNDNRKFLRINSIFF